MASSCLTLLLVTVVVSVSADMNGQYSFANQKNGTNATHRGTGYFDVYTPVIESHYGEVVWNSHNVPLPENIVKQFAGKMMNIVGYEFDIVRIDNKTGKETSVPGWEQYNHHYNNFLYGAGTKYVRTGIPADVAMSDETAHFNFPGYAFVNTEVAEDGVSAPKYSSQFLPMGNGAESRLTFHYFPPGYGAQILSPTHSVMTPMIIDTKNREGTKEPKTRHGIVPPSSNVGPDEMYSGLMECPCTDKYPKKLSSYSTANSGVCSALMKDATTCFATASDLGISPVKQNLTVNSTTSPSGCFATAISGGFEITFNSFANSPAKCGVKSSTPRLTAMANDLVDIVVDMNPEPAKPAPSLAGVFNCPVGNYEAIITQMGDQVHCGCACVAAGCRCFKNSSGVVTNGQMKVFSIIANIAADNNSLTFTNGVQWFRNNAVGGNVTIELTGPSDVWFGAGFGSTGASNGGEATGLTMATTPYTITVLGDGSVQERKLGDHAPGTLLPTAITVLNSTVSNGRRTVFLTRTMAGATSDHLSFTPTMAKLPYLNAVGSSATFGIHKVKGSGLMFFIEVDGPTCVCDMSADQGTIGGAAWGPQRCQPRPLSQLLDDPHWASNDNVNPTCELKAYKGGLRCCKDGTVLLDSNQTVSQEPDYYQLKYRYYYEEGGPQVKDTYWTYWWTENNNNEHDIPPCFNKDCTYALTSNFTAEMMPGFDKTLGAKGTYFIHVEGHCHIGCQSMELWIMDEPQHPQLLCKTQVKYGTGDVAHNEMGYILGNLPCVFGDAKDGFEEPILLKPDTKLMSIKYQNNTNPRYGDMALWEIRATYA